MSKKRKLTIRGLSFEYEGDADGATELIRGIAETLASVFPPDQEPADGDDNETAAGDVSPAGPDV